MNGRRSFGPWLPLVLFAAALSGWLWAGVSEADVSHAGKPPAAVGGDGWRVVAVYPHDRQAYTQGLLYHEGLLYESTGLYGSSSLRKVDLTTGRILVHRPLAARHFGEGLAAWQGTLLQLTWRSNLGLIYDMTDLRPRGIFAYPGEGWGLTEDGRRLIMSDGTARLRFLDPLTLRETGRMIVRDGEWPLSGLNELEVVRGELLANIYPTDRIARISLQSGRVTGWIDLGGLLPAGERQRGTEVPNGIAYDPRTDRLFVTGKFWPRLYEIAPVSAAKGTTP